MSGKGEKGLTKPERERKEELVKELRIRFEYVQVAIDNYNTTLSEANKFIGDMREIFENHYKNHYENRGSNLQNAESYYDFLRQWQDIQLDKIEIEDSSIVLEELSDEVIR
jgi:hypothetical protein